MLILASTSPRRAELIAMLGVPFEVVPSEVDETPLPGEPPGKLAARLARAKATASAVGRAPDDVVVGADTIVVVDGDALGKPIDAADASRMLRRLSGRSHEVITAVALAHAGGIEEFLERTIVTFATMGHAEIDRYVAGGEPLDKAGAYGIQGSGGRWITQIEGSYHNVVGLPLAQLATRLAAIDDA